MMVRPPQVMFVLGSSLKDCTWSQIKWRKGQGRGPRLERCHPRKLPHPACRPPSPPDAGEKGLNCVTSKLKQWVRINSTACQRSGFARRQFFELTSAGDKRAEPQYGLHDSCSPYNPKSRSKGLLQSDCSGAFLQPGLTDDLVFDTRHQVHRSPIGDDALQGSFASGFFRCIRSQLIAQRTEFTGSLDS